MHNCHDRAGSGSVPIPRVGSGSGSRTSPNPDPGGPGTDEESRKVILCMFADQNSCSPRFPLYVDLK